MKQPRGLKSNKANLDKICIKNYNRIWPKLTLTKSFKTKMRSETKSKEVA